MSTSLSISSTSIRTPILMCWVRLLVIVSTILFVTSTFASPIIFNVAVDTTAIQTSTGNLDFQFNTNGPSSLAASVAVTGFVSDATLDGTSQADGGGSGILPGSLTIANSTAFNAVLQGLTFGSFLSLELAITGPAVDTPTIGADTSSFSLSLLDSAFIPLLTTDFLGDILTIDLLDNGESTVTTFDADGVGTPSVVTVSSPATSVPVPPVLTLLLPIVWTMLLRRQRHASTVHRSSHA